MGNRRAAVERPGPSLIPRSMGRIAIAAVQTVLALLLTGVGPSLAVTPGTNGPGRGSSAGVAAASATGTTYHALTPARILDTRDGTGGLSGPFVSHVARTFQPLP